MAKKKRLAAFAVGGVVRDLFLNRFSKDIDILVIGSGIELAHAVAADISPSLVVNVFKNFGTAQFIFEGAAVEFVGARKESYDFNSRKPTVETGTLEEDLSRRDFTINAMAIGISGEKERELVDLFNGFDDLHTKILRTPLDPDITFSDDPLRMMRAVRFASQLGFTIESKTLEAIRRNAHRLEIISKERIMDEFNKILLSKKPSVGIHLCETTGLLTQFLPELLALKGVEVMNGIGHKENYLHTLQVVDKIALVHNNLWLLWAALLHDIAKPLTKKFDDKAGWSFHGHEYLGSKMVKRIFNNLKLPANEKMRYVQKIVALHLRPIALVEEEITDSAVRRLLFDAGNDIEDLMLLCEADVTSTVPEKIKRCMDNFANVRAKLKEIEEKDRLRNWQPPITGELIMQTFHLQPCREIGLIKDAIREAILDGTISNDFSAAYNMMMDEGKKLGLSICQKLDRKKQPQIREFESWKAQTPDIFQKADGIPVFFFRNNHLDMIHILIKVKAGTLYEPVKFIANATCQLLKESSAKYSSTEMDDFLAFHGASWKTYIHTQFITIRWIVPKRNLDKALPVLWDTLAHPIYRNGDLQRFKESKIKDLEYNQGKFAFRATQLMFAAMFPPDMPIGKILTKEHIEALTIEQLQNYHQQTFLQNDIRIFVTGNLDEEITIPLLRLSPLASRPLPFTPRLSLHPSPLTPNTVIEPRENALQSSFILCSKNLAYNHDDRRNFEILSVLYGGYFGSRLMQNLREENGYTYGVFCNSIFYENESIFYIEADVKVAKTKEAMDACFEEMSVLHSELVSEEELSLVKSFMLGELLREVDGSVSYQKKYAFWNSFNLDETELQSMIDAINGITPQTIQALAKQYLVPEMFTLIVVGKLQKKKITKC